MTDQSKIDGWKALAEAAEKARDLSADHQTPGVWMHLFGDRFVYTRLEDGCRGRRVVGVDCISSPADNVALDYVAKANPTSILALIAEVERLREWDSFQQNVDAWMDACFGAKIKADQLERADRFVEEALELSQTFPEFTAERAHALVDYVFNRAVGSRPQEVGGVMVTLAALCNTVNVSVEDAAKAELARIWTKVDQIRAKQAAKPTGSALPVKAVIEATARQSKIKEDFHSLRAWTQEYLEAWKTRAALEDK